jgi:hypothetical protein
LGAAGDDRVRGNAAGLGDGGIDNGAQAFGS